MTTTKRVGRGGRYIWATDKQQLDTCVTWPVQISSHSPLGQRGVDGARCRLPKRGGSLLTMKEAYRFREAGNMAQRAVGICEQMRSLLCPGADNVLLHGAKGGRDYD